MKWKGGIGGAGARVLRTGADYFHGVQSLLMPRTIKERNIMNSYSKVGYKYSKLLNDLRSKDSYPLLHGQAR
jgi:hypothetical protein